MRRRDTFDWRRPAAGISDQPEQILNLAGCFSCIIGTNFKSFRFSNLGMLPDEGTERRRHLRMNLPLKASMDFGCNTPKRTCMIRNISESGACLHIGLLLDPPEYFDL